MDYGQDDIGPALKRLRKAAGLPANRLAARIRRSGANVSRIERSGSNPKLSSLLRYLDAVGADLGDLHAELRESGDPLDDAVAAVDRRIREDAAYRQLARSMLERFGGPEPPPALRALADLIDRQGEQLDRQADQVQDHGERLRRLEEERTGDEDPPAAAPDGGPAER